MEGQCYTGSIHSLRLFTCRVRKQLKRLGDSFFFFSYIAYFCSFSLFSFVKDKSFILFRQVPTCVLRILIPAPVRNPFSHPFRHLPRRAIVARVTISFSNCWFARDVTVAVLVVKNKSISLLYFQVNFSSKNSIVDHQHGRLVTSLQTKKIE